MPFRSDATDVVARGQVDGQARGGVGHMQRVSRLLGDQKGIKIRERQQMESQPKDDVYKQEGKVTTVDVLWYYIHASRSRTLECLPLFDTFCQTTRDCSPTVVGSGVGSARKCAERRKGLEREKKNSISAIRSCRATECCPVTCLLQSTRPKMCP
jgi:hypothetical protein